MAQDSLIVRLKRLTELFRGLSSDPDPVRSVTRYAVAMRELYGEQGLISVSMRGLPDGHYRVMRLLHQTGVSYPGITDMLFAGPQAPIETGGFFGPVIASREPAVFRNLVIDDDPIFGSQLAPYRLFAFLPIFNDGEVTNYTVFLHTDPNGFDDATLEQDYLQANLIGGVTNSKRLLQELRQANAWIHSEVDEIAAIMRGLLPNAMPDIPGCAIGAYFDTFDKAGGDFYDVFPIPGGGGRAGLFIADASGHGPSAAVVAAMVAALLRAYPGPWDSPGAVLGHLNNELMKKAINHSFVTAYFAIYDPATRTLRYSSAGHNMPLRRARSGAVSMYLPTGGVPLSIVAPYVYQDAETLLEPGDALLLYTDGVTEAMSETRAAFGEERLMTALASAPAPPSAMLEAIVSAVRTHEGRKRPDDDRTMVALLVE